MQKTEPPPNRKEVWIAISEFYLDTELQETDYQWIYNVFKTSGLSLKTLKSIDMYEVFPTLQANLNSVAGEWAGFDEKWLVEVCTRNYRKRNNLIFRIIIRWRNRLSYWMRKDHWVKMEELYAKSGTVNS